MNFLRLSFQRALSFIAIPLGFNHRLSQFCDRCGRTNWTAHWWDDTNEAWEAVAGNVNGHRHGCFCINCFTVLAGEKGILIVWKPILERGAQREEP